MGLVRKTPIKSQYTTFMKILKNRLLAKASLMALPLLVASPSAFGAVTVIENVSITATTQTSAQWIEIDAQSPGTFIVEHAPDVDFAAGDYTISIKSRVNDSIPDKGTGRSL